MYQQSFEQLQSIVHDEEPIRLIKKYPGYFIAVHAHHMQENPENTFSPTILNAALIDKETVLIVKQEEMSRVYSFILKNIQSIIKNEKKAKIQAGNRIVDIQFWLSYEGEIQSGKY